MIPTRHVGQGDVEIGKGVETSFSTILGSCVAICLFDPESEIGGMIHYRLPHEPDASVMVRDHALYGPKALGLLYAALLSEGAQKTGIKAKIFGGGAVVNGLGDIGQMNAAFAETALLNMGIPVLAQDLGGTVARRVRFLPGIGTAHVQRIQMPTPG